MKNLMKSPVKTSLKTGAALLAALTLSACGGPLAPNELRLDNDGGGKFSGSAGTGWTAEELNSHISASFCGGRSIVNFQVLVLDGGKVVSGQCAAG